MLFVSSMDHRVKHGQFCLSVCVSCLQCITELSWSVWFFDMLFVPSVYHRVTHTVLSFGMLFVSSVFHRVIMGDFDSQLLNL